MRAQSHQLDDATHVRITGLCGKADELAEADDLDGALRLYREALALLPQPVDEWEAATWIFTALGDVLFRQGNYSEARDALTRAMRCPGAIGNPFVHLRLGQSQLELKQYDRAKDELARAYMGGGDEIFDGESSKYKNFIKEILRPRGDL